ncbi:MAG: hypothetical protein M1336_02885 [Deltaproteobacteria bacterium]|nr:hypothetical protein [Deltaproteobacteria bacterium]
MTSRVQSFETELLTRPENLAGLGRINRELVVKGEAIAPRRRVVLDMDSPVLSEAEGTEIVVYIVVYSRQEGRAYNGHFQSALRLRSGRGLLPSAAAVH